MAGSATLFFFGNEFSIGPTPRMAHKPTRLVLALTALLAPATALASINPVGQNAWTLWAFGNGNVVYNLLYAAKGLVSSSGYLALVGFLSLISVVAASVMAANNAMASKRLVAAILGIFAFISIGLKETANVAVDDPVTHYINVVPNVPALVAIPPAVVSEAGYRMTQLLEQYYSLPNDLTLTGGDAFDLANSLVNAETQVQVTSPGLRATVAGFTTNCILPALASGQLNAGQLVDSTALWSMDGQQGTLAQAEQSPFTPVYTGSSPGGTLVPCGPGGVGTGPWYPTVTSTEYPSVSADNAYQYISQYFTAASPDWLANTASTFSNTATYSWLGSELTSAEQWDFGTSLTQSTGETIAQAAAVNLMNPSMRAAAVASGDSPLVTSLAVSQGQQSQISSWATAAALFRDLSGYIFSVLQAFILGIAPIILAVVVLPGAGRRILLSYGQVLIWLALWEPTMSVINFIVALYAQGTLGPTLGSSGGYSLMNQGVITQMTSNMELAAGFLASMVPLITWGLVKGSIAFTDFVVGAVGSSFATTAGAMAATGNVSLENFSMGNETLNQRMLASRTTVGQGQGTVDVPGQGVTTTRNYGGGVTRGPGGPDTLSTSTTNSQAVAALETKAHKYGVDAGESAGRAASLAAGAIAQEMNDYSAGHSTSHGTSAGTSASTGVEGSTAYKGVTQALIKQDASEQTAKEVGAEWGARLTPGQRQQAAGAANQQANQQAKAGNEKAATGLRGFASGVLGSFSVGGGVQGSTANSSKIGTTGSHSTSGSNEAQYGTDAGIKRSAAANRVMQATLGYMLSAKKGLSTDDKATLTTALSLSRKASQDWSRQQSALRQAAMARTYGIQSRQAASRGVGQDYPREQARRLDARIHEQAQGLYASTGSALDQARNLHAKAAAAATAAQGTIAAHPAPTPGQVGNQVTATSSRVAAGLAAQEHTVTNAAGRRFTAADHGMGAARRAAHADGAKATTGANAELGAVSASDRSYKPPNVATGQNPGGASDGLILGLGGLYMGVGGIANAFKNWAQSTLAPPGGSGAKSGTEGNNSGTEGKSGPPADTAPGDPAVTGGEAAGEGLLAGGESLGGTLAIGSAVVAGVMGVAVPGKLGRGERPVPTGVHPVSEQQGEAWLHRQEKAGASSG